MIRTTFIALFACVAAGLIQAADYSSLLNNSPFAPLGPGAAAGGDKSVEFRGHYFDSEKGSTIFSIYDTATQRSAWVGMNETGHPFVVRSYNASNDTVTVELNGHNVNLGLKLATVQLAAAPKPVAPAAQPAENGPQRGGRWMQNVMGADGRPDPKRMEAFIEEMRRRRAQRMQSFGAQNPGEGGTGAPMPAGANVAPGTGSSPMPMPAPGRGGEGGNIPMPTPGAGPGAVPVDMNNPNR
ncbi:MAG TPA: hypothetical protein VHD32_11125 [Candidatus Didemnitutus sp.]|nr:hypothetical protein [Candidatus Didemnitutus sp.]